MVAHSKISTFFPCRFVFDLFFFARIIRGVAFGEEGSDINNDNKESILEILHAWGLSHKGKA